MIPRAAARALKSVAPNGHMSIVRPFSSCHALSQPKIMLEDPNGFGFIRHNARPPKPRQTGVTEIRGPYYSAMGKRYLKDVLETMGYHVDGLKFAGGSFSLFPEDKLRELLDLAHEHGGGWIEHVLTQSDAHSAVDRYLKRCKSLGFDVMEISTGFLSIPPDDWMRLIDKVHSAGLVAKPEIGIQFGAGGDTEAGALESLGSSDPSKVVNLGKRFINDAGVERIMIESEGITENVKNWRTDVIQGILRELPADRVMFEAAETKVFNWYIREFGADVNLFVDHSQIVQVSCLREGIWGMADTFGKITTFR
ncbi:putative sulfonate biosynthesis enzyme protein [Phaeoacremonium minimum UCRPA7]|uniref:Putative sulfonate biosynthesis enzyme protein n=1 Tax=Phaeoacremonium minimum (strain UCR-PA7) TaxID=1286976 RepID=R8BPF6_PHAM7|nr:putative sulfonate biosynthesis enzyme protein [Phaeoacremonium minimum UCRPA7]EOO01221.1 putative sulfonate biosynthesis enzyme protein [Phaeoacremonium minimum UCRPA7]